MLLKLEVRRYRRHFKNPLYTGNGALTERNGILIRIEDAEGKVGFGEAAPLKWFGTESFQDAFSFLNAWGKEISPEAWLEVPMSLPCCRFAFDSALKMLDGGLQKKADAPIPVAALLPNGNIALDWIEKLQEEGYRTFKWKIGVDAPEIEFGRLEGLLEKLYPDDRIRLDANGALDLESAIAWGERLANIPQIEYLEQPLPLNQMLAYKELQKVTTTPIAFDESTTHLPDLSAMTAGGWDGYIVCKPLIHGPLDTIANWRRIFPGKLSFSSVFETAIGMEILLQIAAEDEEPLALGAGTLAYFEDDGFSLHPVGPELTPGKVSLEDMQTLWRQLPE